ncbi:hypothetical protein [Porphyrobacter sp. ULC335]|uniref:hypothetical protein n=1 Tax=Porphyrobacter sp. ULC335 TaxID=2854260 RepID=UPI002220DD04|nr:hypothetical protein [Porphyrobacter sp. ULC335]UYV14928.1 hypothetical protein KVF90_12395 [Porphyrobacter sp. ULC335]
MIGEELHEVFQILATTLKRHRFSWPFALQGPELLEKIDRQYGVTARKVQSPIIDFIAPCWLTPKRRMELDLIAVCTNIWFAVDHFPKGGDANRNAPNSKHHH